MPNNELPQRDPFTGPPSAYAGETDTELLGAVACALREGAGPLNRPGGGVLSPPPPGAPTTQPAQAGVQP
jgi:hypothetical protein